MQTVHSTSTPAGDAGPSPRLVMLMAASAGMAVASLYYSQPMLGDLAAQLHARDDLIGFVPMLTQLGYALGILFLAPLGDRYDRRRIILAKIAALVLALLATAAAPSLGMLLVASLAVGLTATLAQDIVPAAATLAPAAHRGRIVGQVMTGLLLGILLSRVVSGVAAQALGWRAVYAGAALGILLAGIALWRGFPAFRPTTDLSYGALLGSMKQLLWRHAPLRRAALSQGLLSVGFSAFWSALAVMLHGAPFHLGSAAAGAFGLAGAAGALAAPIAGRLADRRGPEFTVRLGAGLAAASFLAMLALPLLHPAQQLALIAVSAIGFDFGIQAALVSHQTQVYALDPAARSRLNALLFTGMFIGLAVGSVLGTLAFAHLGWQGVVWVAAASALAALAVRLTGRRTLDPRVVFRA